MADNILELDQNIQSDIQNAISALEGLGDKITPEQANLLETLRSDLLNESGGSLDFDSLGSRLGEQSALIIGDDRGKFEQAWGVVFQEFPITLAQFTECVNRDEFLDELRPNITDPAIATIFSQQYNDLMAVWRPLKADAESKISFLRRARAFTVTLNGLVHDHDSIGGDEHLDINESVQHTMRFGDNLPIVKRWVADQEVSLDLNVNCRFTVSNDIDTPLLIINGNGECKDDDDPQGTMNINTTLSKGQASPEFVAGNTGDDHAKLKFTYDISV